MGEEKYRNDEREGILACLREYAPFTTLPVRAQEWTVRVIERSLFNSTIDKAKEKNIPTYWGEDNFVAQYASLGYTLKINLDINSSVNRDRPKKIREYAVSKVYNFLAFRYFRSLVKKMGLFPVELCDKIQKLVPYFDLRRVGTLNSQELNPLINEPYIIQLKIRSEQGTKIKFSTMYTCSSCGEKKTKLYELQTRSLDEGGTLFVQCVICGKVWTSRMKLKKI